MKSTTLSKTNPYLKNKTQAKKLMVRSIASNTAIETGQPISKIEAKLGRPRSAGYRVKLA